MGFRTIQVCPKDLPGHPAAGSCSHDRLQEARVMTWSDSPWVLIYSILVTLFILLWAYVPA